LKAQIWEVNFGTLISGVLITTDNTKELGDSQINEALLLILDTQNYARGKHHGRRWQT
jgi:hypothetical protein